jgi:hypothetical protein
MAGLAHQRLLAKAAFDHAKSPSISFANAIFLFHFGNAGDSSLIRLTRNMPGRKRKLGKLAKGIPDRKAATRRGDGVEAPPRSEKITKIC